MRIVETALPGVLIVEPELFRDARGFFLETYHARKYAALGILRPFVQDNHSFSVRGTLRGLHAQRARPQGKLVWAADGEVFDVAVDIRRGSPAFGQWVGVTLTGESGRQLYLPPGFAHGFCVRSQTAHVEYKCTDFYDPTDELTVRWDDPDLGIVWPVAAPILSPRDAAAPRLAELMDRLPRYAPGR